MMLGKRIVKLVHARCLDPIGHAAAGRDLTSIKPSQRLKKSKRPKDKLSMALREE